MKDSYYHRSSKTWSFSLRRLCLFLTIPQIILYGHFTYGFMPPIRTKAWSPTSWRHVRHQSNMIPHYHNDTTYQYIQDRLQKSAPIIFAQEARILQHELALASLGKSFVFIGGDCAETFQDSNVMKLWKDFSLFVELSLLLTHGLEIPVVKIGRMCGQFAKPRSTLLETINNITLPSYQGDIINSPNFTKEHRLPNPIRMLDAYHHSVQSINILRAFIQGGYTDIFNHESWSLFHTVGDPIEFIYNRLLKDLKKSLRFMKALQISSSSNKYLREISFFIGHEALLLPYEECLVRKDSLTDLHYDCSAHYLWIGERTRELQGSHIEFCRGIHNPIGIKISEKITPEELLNITYVLNPKNELGRLSIITRMGAKHLKHYLPNLITTLQMNSRNVVWICDPMHANTKTFTSNSSAFKTRYFMDIWMEIQTFFEIHWSHDSIPAGIHLEMTGQNVTECLGGYAEPIVDFHNYQTAMDPRLNPTQTMEIMLLLCQLFEHRRKTLHLDDDKSSKFDITKHF